MSHSDDVREYCYRTYILPAKQDNLATINILSGDVHRALNYTNRYPLVCNALGTLIFEKTYKVSRLAIEGPLNGASTLFKFKIND